eukprot:CAMPEP_0204241286 /NCGR_PEP_ID=MMETSP0361-20130328/95313_1 /ASSEMBLY_ACC=CAM_ASM_000343 /TAXON_ID=268821 /ORGANISM="Scrippsiella Hangoei, Strain SHTV-5" /LENGTH=100 /DNA_ID=CAMNT_0051214095 /DNA_START=283 /DNA_END=582 /DNA_ORIENTATION=+
MPVGGERRRAVRAASTNANAQLGMPMTAATASKLVPPVSARPGAAFHISTAIADEAEEAAPPSARISCPWPQGSLPSGTAMADRSATARPEEKALLDGAT